MHKISGFLRLMLVIALLTALANLSLLRPSLAAASPSLAALMPADTFTFTEIDLSNLPNMVKNIQSVLTRVGLSANFVSDLNKGLTTALGRPASLEKDVYPWLGDRVGLGVDVPSSVFEAVFTHTPQNSKQQPFEAYFVASIKAASLAPPAFQHFWYVNVTRVHTLAQQLASRSSTQSDRQMIAVIGLFKSAVMYSTDLGSGSSLTTVVLLLK